MTSQFTVMPPGQPAAMPRGISPFVPPTYTYSQAYPVPNSQILPPGHFTIMSPGHYAPMPPVYNQMWPLPNNPWTNQTPISNPAILLGRQNNDRHVPYALDQTNRTKKPLPALGPVQKSVQKGAPVANMNRRDQRSIQGACVLATMRCSTCREQAPNLARLSCDHQFCKACLYLLMTQPIEGSCLLCSMPSPLPLRKPSLRPESVEPYEIIMMDAIADAASAVRQHRENEEIDKLINEILDCSKFM